MQVRSETGLAPITEAVVLRSPDRSTGSTAGLPESPRRPAVGLSAGSGDPPNTASSCCITMSAARPPRRLAPLETPLGPGAHKRISAAGGRPTNSDLSYFNLEWGGRGLIIAVGWPGQWAAEFARDAARACGSCAGQELTHFKLHPGEEVRTPLVVLQFWQGGDWIRAQNLWRRWMVAHNLPRPGGQLVPTHYGGCFGNLQPRADEEIAQIDGSLREGIKLDYWFIDAGWYPGDGSWVTWAPGRWTRSGSRAGCARWLIICTREGIKFVVWFEPERVAAGHVAGREPPGVDSGRQERRPAEPRQSGSLELGRRACRRPAHQRRHRRLSAGLQHRPAAVLARQRCAGPPGHHRDQARRRATWPSGTSCCGAIRTAHRHLRQRRAAQRPGDAAALGAAAAQRLGRGGFSPAGADGQQCQTYGLSLWMPYHGTGMPLTDAYTMRSSFAPAYRIGWDASKKDLDHAAAAAHGRRLPADGKVPAGRLLPAHAVQPGEQRLDGLAVRPPGVGRGRGASVSPRGMRSRVGTPEIARTGGRRTVRDHGPRFRPDAEIAGSEILEKGLLVNAPSRPSAPVLAVSERTGRLIPMAECVPIT